MLLFTQNQILRHLFEWLVNIKFKFYVGFSFNVEFDVWLKLVESSALTICYVWDLLIVDVKKYFVLATVVGIVAANVN